MTANHFDLAPAQTAGTTTADLPQTPAPQAPAKPRNTKQPQPPDTPTDGTLGGVLIPGGALTTLIGLCWLIHQFGLPAVILGLIACAAAATTALVMKARGKNRKAPRPRSVLRSSGGGGPGRVPMPRQGAAGSGRTGGGSGSSAGASGTSKGGGGARRGATSGNGLGGGAGAAFGRGGAKTAPNRTSGAAGGSASRKPGGFGSSKTSPAATPNGKRNTTPKTPRTPLGKGAAATGGATKTPRTDAPKQDKRNKRSAATGGGTGKTRRGLLGQTKNTPNTPATTSGRKGSTTSPTPKKTPSSTKQGRLSRALDRKKNTLKPSSDKGHHKTRPTHGTATRPSSPKEIKAAKKLDKATRNNKGHTGTTPKPAGLKAKPKKTSTKKPKNSKPWKSHTTNPHRAPIGPGRRGTYWAGKKLRKHTSRKTRMRIKKVVSPARRLARHTNRIASPALARAWRTGTRAFLNAHMALGTFRYMGAGPNWARPLARLLHTLTSPAAKLVAATGSWGWLNRWMYQHTAPLSPNRATAPTTRPATTTTPATRPGHNTVTAPGTTTPQENPVSTEAAAPLEQAAESILNAGAMLLTNPAENMVGYEATLNALAVIQHNISTVMQQAGETTRENFKVNPAVSEAYDDSAAYAQSLGDRLGEIPVLFRTLHEEQIENIENPTVQARKWDITANE